MATKGERVKELRKALNMSANDFGKRIGISHAAISHIESDKNNLSSRTALAICEAFNVTPEWLENGIGEMFATKDRDQQFYDAVAEIDFQGNEIVKQIIISYANLSEEKQKVFLDFVHEVYEKAMQQKKSTGE